MNPGYAPRYSTGFALLSSVTFGSHGVTCSNRFLASSWYRRALTEDALPAGGFDSPSVHRRSHLSDDNANMNITHWRNELEALGDTPQSILIDPATLATVHTKRWAHLHRCCAVSYTHLRAHETRHDLVCRLLLE